jgi:hypothetical protein
LSAVFSSIFFDFARRGGQLAWVCQRLQPFAQCWQIDCGDANYFIYKIHQLTLYLLRKLLQIANVRNTNILQKELRRTQQIQ